MPVDVCRERDRSAEDEPAGQYVRAAPHTENRARDAVGHEQRAAPEPGFWQAKKHQRERRGEKLEQDDRRTEGNRTR